jgi:phosphate:Na+ symporter
MLRHRTLDLMNKYSPVQITFLIFFILFFSSHAIASPEEAGEINWLNMGMGLFGGLALFLFGMDQMAEGLKAATGEGLKTLLAKLTKNRFMGAISGAFVTAVLNSSSVTTVLVVGFITAGIMSLSQSISIIMGANIGSTFTAQIVAFNVTQYALLMVAIGFAMLFTGKQDKVRHYGSMVMGLGLVFFGMGVMSEAMTPLRTYDPFLELMVKMESPLLGILVGAVFTGLVQSSAATTGLAIVMASEGLMSLPAGIALAFGANIGTCVTAVLAAIGKPTEAKRAAAAHILFNIFGVIIWIAFIPELAEFVARISPAHPELTGTSRSAAEVPRQIANAHTVFNVANTFLFIGFTGSFAQLVKKLVPEKEEISKVIIEPKFLNSESLEMPSIALNLVRLEIGHMGENVQEMLDKIRSAYRSKKHEELEAVAKLDDKTDILHSEIINYLNKLFDKSITTEQQKEIITLIRITEDMERVGDVIETTLVEIGHAAIDQNMIDTGTTRHALQNLYENVKSALAISIKSVVDTDETASQDVLHLKEKINHLIEEALEFQEKETKLNSSEAIIIARFEDDVIDSLKRIYSLSKRIAKHNMPEALLQIEA